MIRTGHVSTLWGVVTQPNTAAPKTLIAKWLFFCLTRGRDVRGVNVLVDLVEIKKNRPFFKPQG